MWRSAWLRGARAEPWAGPPAGGAGEGFRGHAPGALVQKCRLFFLSAGAVSFDPQGKVLLMIIGADLPTPSGKPQEAARQVVAYFGTYSVDEGAKTITYTAERATTPAFDGLVRKATVTVTGDELRQSSAPVSGPQGTFTPHLVMRRAK